jgi:hypothetical protein
MSLLYVQVQNAYPLSILYICPCSCWCPFSWTWTPLILLFVLLYIIIFVINSFVLPLDFMFKIIFIHCIFFCSSFLLLFSFVRLS